MKHSHKYGLNLFARWQQHLWSKRWRNWGDRLGTGGWNCYLNYLPPDTSEQTLP